MKTIFLRPALPEYKVYHPGGRRRLKPSGEKVRRDAYWVRTMVQGITTEVPDDIAAAERSIPTVT